MRIWKVPPVELDTQRVLAAHHEWHVVWNQVMQGRSWMGWEPPQFRADLLDQHQALAVEMFIRGINHNSPVDYTLPPVRQETRYWTFEELELDRWTLVCRWDGQYRGRLEPVRAEHSMVVLLGDDERAPRAIERQLVKPPARIYAELIDKYKEQGGCLHDQGAVGRDDRCALCKRVVYVGQGQWAPAQGGWGPLP